MIVNLKRNWFAPGGVMFRSIDNPHEFPADWEDQLPDDAEVVGGKTNAKLAAKVDDPKVDGLTAGNAPLDATAIVAGTEEDNSNLTDAQADKVKAQRDKAAKDGVGATGSRPSSAQSPAQEASTAAKEGSTPSKDGKLTL